jgi:hypothetical protein
LTRSGPENDEEGSRHACANNHDMAKHEVGLEIAHTTSLGRVDIKIPVRANGDYLGSLNISKGGIDWVVGRTAKYGRYSLRWEAFDALMQEHVREQPLRKAGRRAPRKRASDHSG